MLVGTYVYSSYFYAYFYYFHNRHICQIRFASVFYILKGLQIYKLSKLEIWKIFIRLNDRTLCAVALPGFDTLDYEIIRKNLTDCNFAAL